MNRIMEQLSDRLLIEAYCKAVELELSREFLTLIREEMNHRFLAENHLHTSASHPPY